MSDEFVCCKNFILAARSKIGARQKASNSSLFKKFCDLDYKTSLLVEHLQEKYNSECRKKVLIRTTSE